MDDDSGGVKPFYVMQIVGEAAELEAEGRSICYAVSGEPAAPPAPAVRAAMAEALGQRQGYTHSKGQIELRRAIADYYRAQHGVAVDPEAVLVTTGASAAFMLVFLAAFAPGAPIAVTRPGYPAYLNILLSMNFRPVEIPLSEQRGWRLSADDIAAAYAREPFAALLFASPANPTGVAVSREELGEIIDCCRRLGVRLILDEIYHGLDYRGPSASALEFGPDTIVVNSFSKYYCMPGARVGWAVLPDDLVARTEMLQQNLFISAPTLSQVGARVALTERDYAEAQKAGYARNRQILADGLRKLGLESTVPDGAFYTYVDIGRLSNDSLGFARRLLHEAGLATAPGVDFDRVNGNRFLRFSYAGSEATMRDALERLGRFLRA